MNTVVWEECKYLLREARPCAGKHGRDASIVAAAQEDGLGARLKGERRHTLASLRGLGSGVWRGVAPYQDL